MGRVTYGQSGYVGSSMSERAAQAYVDGEMPRSRWTRSAIVSAIRACAADEGHELPDGIDGLTRDELFARFMRCTGWHHTGKYARATDFYDVDADAVEDVCERGMGEVMADVRHGREVARAMRAMPDGVPAAYREERAEGWATWHRDVFLDPAIRDSLLSRFADYLSRRDEDEEQG